MHGEQEEAAYNGHFGCMCYHPLSDISQMESSAFINTPS